MPRFLSYRSLRGLQISTVFFFTIVVQEWLRYPRAGWTGFTVMMIYAGFDNGTTIFRAYHRFFGVLLGLLSGYFLWFIGHLDYRMLFIVIPTTIFFAYFFAGRAYSVPTLFTVNTSLIGYGYFNMQDTSTVTYFIIDYGLCTFVAFTIILGFEYLWFRHYGLMSRFLRDTQAMVIRDLCRLVYLLNQGKVRRTDWFKGCIALTESLFEVSKLVNNSQFMVSSERAIGDKFSVFTMLSNQMFVCLKALYIERYTMSYYTIDKTAMLQQIQADIAQLKTCIADEHITNSNYGVIDVAPG